MFSEFQGLEMNFNHLKKVKLFFHVIICKICVFQNILLKSGVIKLGDFGLTHLMKALSEKEMIYTAPEVLATAKTIYGEKKVPQFTQQSDIYSIGRVLLEMCNLQLSDDQSQQKIPERFIFSCFVSSIIL